MSVVLKTGLEEDGMEAEGQRKGVYFREQSVAVAGYRQGVVAAHGDT